MIRRPIASVGIVAVALIMTLTLAAGSAAAEPAAPPGTPTAVQFKGVPSVGAIFKHGLHNPHTCSASVVQSPGHDLILGAAHCISGTGAGILFAPGYANGKTAYGVWTVLKTWVSRTWNSSHDPHNDYAFLQVASQVINNRRVNIQDVTGGAVLGVAAPASTSVTDIAYRSGINDSPITCTAKLTLTGGYPTFNCNGYPGGTSGSPFLVKHLGQPNVVVGVIGGLHQGGCYQWNSFSSPFGSETYRTYQRATYRLPANTVTAAGSDGC
jgi:hypothetical protein